MLYKRYVLAHAPTHALQPTLRDRGGRFGERGEITKRRQPTRTIISVYNTGTGRWDERSPGGPWVRSHSAAGSRARLSRDFCALHCSSALIQRRLRTAQSQKCSSHSSVEPKSDTVADSVRCHRLSRSGGVHRRTVEAAHPHHWSCRRSRAMRACACACALDSRETSIQRVDSDRMP